MTRARYCVGVPNFGPAPQRLGIGQMAEQVEKAGFDGVWLTDHVVLVEGHTSVYPYSRDGRFFLPSDSDWFEALTALAFVAARTERVELGIGVLVLPLRNPYVLAKQLATVDRLSGGRVQLAVGSGWLREEMTALGVDPTTRGARTDAAIDLLRACWTGAPPAGEYGPFVVPAGVRSNPTPVRGTIPIHVGGHSPAAERRVVARCDGWFAAGAYPRGPGAAELGAAVERMRARSDRPLEISLRLAVPPGALGGGALSEALAAYVEAGVQRFVFDFGWRSEDDARDRLERLMATVSTLPARG
jgi:probable F420-dependent oxidoreductase